MIIRKAQLHIIFNEWWESDLDDILNGIKKEDVINVVVEDGRVYVIYWED